MSMRLKPLIIANWKMNPSSRRAAGALLRRLGVGLAHLTGVDVIIAPPFPYLDIVARARGRVITLGAQDVFWHDRGAYTGEISPPMLRDLGVRYVMIGHSERRRIMGESNAMVHDKITAALRSGLIPVIAIGEEIPDAHAVVPRVLAEQLRYALAGIARRKLSHSVVAYEPVWAIGTGRADTPDNATRRAIYIRKILTTMLGYRIADTIRIIYGGSVTSKNAVNFLSRDIRGMEGLLVGGASLQADEFIKIVTALRHRKRE